MNSKQYESQHHINNDKNQQLNHNQLNITNNHNNLKDKQKQFNIYNTFNTESSSQTIYHQLNCNNTNYDIINTVQIQYKNKQQNNIKQTQHTKQSNQLQKNNQINQSNINNNQQVNKQVISTISDIKQINNNEVIQTVKKKKPTIKIIKDYRIISTQLTNNNNLTNNSINTLNNNNLSNTLNNNNNDEYNSLQQQKQRIKQQRIRQNNINRCKQLSSRYKDNKQITPQYIPQILLHMYKKQSQYQSSIIQIHQINLNINKRLWTSIQITLLDKYFSNQQKYNQQNHIKININNNMNKNNNMNNNINKNKNKKNKNNKYSQQQQITNQNNNYKSNYNNNNYNSYEDNSYINNSQNTHISKSTYNHYQNELNHHTQSNKSTFHLNIYQKEQKNNNIYQTPQSHIIPPYQSSCQSSNQQKNHYQHYYNHYKGNQQFKNNQLNYNNNQNNQQSTQKQQQCFNKQNNNQSIKALTQQQSSNNRINQFQIQKQRYSLHNSQQIINNFNKYNNKYNNNINKNKYDKNKYNKKIINKNNNKNNQYDNKNYKKQRILNKQQQNQYQRQQSTNNRQFQQQNKYKNKYLGNYNYQQYIQSINLFNHNLNILNNTIQKQIYNHNKNITHNNNNITHNNNNITHNNNNIFYNKNNNNNNLFNNNIFNNNKNQNKPKTSPFSKSINNTPLSKSSFTNNVLKTQGYFLQSSLTLNQYCKQLQLSTQTIFIANHLYYLFLKRHPQLIYGFAQLKYSFNSIQQHQIFFSQLIQYILISVIFISGKYSQIHYQGLFQILQYFNPTLNHKILIKIQSKIQLQLTIIQQNYLIHDYQIKWLQYLFIILQLNHYNLNNNNKLHQTNQYYYNKSKSQSKITHKIYQNHYHDNKQKMNNHYKSNKANNNKSNKLYSASTLFNFQQQSKSKNNFIVYNIKICQFILQTGLINYYLYDQLFSHKVGTVLTIYLKYWHKQNIDNNDLITHIWELTQLNLQHYQRISNKYIVTLKYCQDKRINYIKNKYFLNGINPNLKLPI